jgi:hypothetical protein
MLGPFKDDAEREKYAADQRERHRANTVPCPHCGTRGGWSYGGLSPAWLGNGNAKLTEYSSERTHWYGVPEFAQEHTMERCFEVVKAQRDAAIVLLHESYKSDRAVAWLREYDAKTRAAG